MYLEAFGSHQKIKLQSASLILSSSLFSRRKKDFETTDPMITFEEEVAEDNLEVIGEWGEVVRTIEEVVVEVVLVMATETVVEVTVGTRLEVVLGEEVVALGTGIVVAEEGGGGDEVTITKTWRTRSGREECFELYIEIIDFMNREYILQIVDFILLLNHDLTHCP